MLHVLTKALTHYFTINSVNRVDERIMDLM